MNRSRDGRIRRYEALKSRLERLLYDYDPEGMGATVGAPLNEYSDVAVSMIRALRDRDPETPPAEAIWDVVPGATADLIAEIDKAWEES